MQSFPCKTKTAHIKRCQARQGEDRDIEDTAVASVLLRSPGWFPDYEATKESLSQSHCGESEARAHSPVQLQFLGLGPVKCRFRKASLASQGQWQHPLGCSWELLPQGTFGSVNGCEDDSAQWWITPCHITDYPDILPSLVDFSGWAHSLYLTIDQCGSSVPVYRMLFCAAI